MYKICVFAGTTEGREVVEFLASQPVAVTACVATEYGETLLPHAEKINVSAKRLTSEEMEDLFRRESFDLVLDATHPYASVVTEILPKAAPPPAPIISGSSGTMPGTKIRGSMWRTSPEPWTIFPARKAPFS